MADAPPVARVLRVAADNAALVALVTLTGAVALLLFPAAFFGSDTWLVLVSGRELVDHGLPSTDALTVWGADATWTNQQWLAHLSYYLLGSGSLGLLLVANTLLGLAAIGLGIAAARTRGATTQATLLLAMAPCLLLLSKLGIRAQSAAYPLFAAVLWLLLRARDGERSPRTLLVLPLLVVWANVHGSVLVGAALVSGYAAIAIAQRRERLRWRGGLLLLLPPLAVLASPYGPADVAAYYRLMVVDPPFAELVPEWQPPSDPFTWVLLLLVAVPAVAAVARRRRVDVFEALVLVTTFALAVSATRGVPWLALASVAIVPPLASRGPAAAPARAARGAALAFALGGPAVLLAAVVLVLAQGPARLEATWPPAAAAAAERAASEPGARLIAPARYADWLLWRVPTLRGRIAYDVRFELYEEPALRRIARFENGIDAVRVTDGYDVIVVDRGRNPALADELARMLPASLVHRDRELEMLTRAVG